MYRRICLYIYLHIVGRETYICMCACVCVCPFLRYPFLEDSQFKREPTRKSLHFSGAPLGDKTIPPTRVAGDHPDRQGGRHPGRDLCRPGGEPVSAATADAEAAEKGQGRGMASWAFWGRGGVKRRCGHVWKDSVPEKKSGFLSVFFEMPKKDGFGFLWVFLEIHKQDGFLVLFVVLKIPKRIGSFFFWFSLKYRKRMGSFWFALKITNTGRGSSTCVIILEARYPFVALVSGENQTETHHCLGPPE